MSEQELEKNTNLRHWICLEKTNPKYTKPFNRSGGFKGTAQNPTYAIKKMTEHFGPIGIGWGYDKPEFNFVNAPDGQVLVYCVLSVWYLDGGETARTYGVGGDAAVGKNKYGIHADDEACKKATTDALTNAMKTIGMAADIHLGQYDDSKYLNFIKEEFGEDKAKEPAQLTPQQKTTADVVKKINAVQRVEDVLGVISDSAKEIDSLSEAQKKHINKIADQRRSFLSQMPMAAE